MIVSDFSTKVYHEHTLKYRRFLKPAFRFSAHLQHVSLSNRDLHKRDNRGKTICFLFTPRWRGTDVFSVWCQSSDNRRLQLRLEMIWARELKKQRFTVFTLTFNKYL